MTSNRVLDNSEFGKFTIPINRISMAVTEVARLRRSLICMHRFPANTLLNVITFSSAAVLLNPYEANLSGRRDLKTASIVQMRRIK
ncbi:predicted protein [Histoplasma mississippiense (nom. inval.)]|uniref:predicted protein n=1 Tax=Ajellomyces capsulatus (strain NAm1 / WU24) TaxID=2059318 RepID=UPI000157D1F0|nr:predicted protein [Histoplasma mississippiense (nom. inval.)]EDN04356.1 predicted protein [Histoplasma mississippiense (nom. inval.)]